MFTGAETESIVKPDSPHGNGMGQTIRLNCGQSVVVCLQKTLPRQVQFSKPLLSVAIPYPGMCGRLAFGFVRLRFLGCEI
jgi:hypothetical protein